MAYQRYELHGLRVEVERPIAALSPTDAVGRADLRIHHHAYLATSEDATALAAEPYYRSPTPSRDELPFVSAWKIGGGESLRLLMHDGTAIVLDGDITEAWVDAPAEVAPSAVDDYLLGPVLALALRRRGIVCLHASAVCIDGAAVAFLGYEGSGKSTIASLLAKRGHAVLTDDLAPLVDEHEQLSVAPAQRAATGPLRLAAIYCLEPFESRCCDVEEITGAEALMALAPHTWATRLLASAEQALELDVLARLAGSVPVRRLPRVHPDLLPDVVERIPTNGGRR